MFELKKANRQQVKLKIWVFWPSWSWKTYSSLLLARWMVDNWNEIALIDTENWSGSLYSHLWDYNVLNLEAPFTPERYIQAIQACIEWWMKIIIIDSISHEWEWKWWILQISEELSQWAKNSYMVWWKITPRHNNFINTILQSPIHIICCWRSKQEYVLNQKEKNWHIINVPEKVWLKAVTREWFDYEMTISFDLMINHYASTSKDRTSIFNSRPEFKIDQTIWQEINKWNLSWEKFKTQEELNQEKQENYTKYFEKLNWITTKEELKKIYESLKNKDFPLKNEHMIELGEMIKNIKAWLEEKNEKWIEKEEEKVKSKLKTIK